MDEARKWMSFSIDGGSLAVETGSARQESQLAQLVELFADYALVATWFLRDPGRSLWAPQIACSLAGHEIALDCCTAWCTDKSPLAAFNELLTCAVRHAREPGFAIESLAIPGALEPQRAALIARLGIETCYAAHSPRHQRDAANNASHDGTLLVSDFSVPASSSVLSVMRDYQLSRKVAARLRRDSHVHVAIQLDRLSAHGVLGIDTIRRLLRSVAMEKQREQLEVRTVAEVMQPWQWTAERRAA
jgi:hypothetical protein